MSDPNEPGTYKSINNDEEKEEEGENYNDDIDSHNASRQVDPTALGSRFNEGRLHNGELINSKNPLQSFDHSETPPPPSAAAAAAATKPIPRLIDGRTIDYKNTMQSYDHLVPPRRPAPLLLNTAPDDGGHVGGAGEALPNTDLNPRLNNSNRNNNNANRNDETVYAEAVAVRSLAAVADAQLADPNPHLRLGGYYWLVTGLLVVLAAVAAGVGVYCGTGNCGGSDDMSPDNEPPSLSTVPNVPLSTNTPIISPATAQQQLAVACNFLSFTSLTECQATTSFNGAAVGNTIPKEIGFLTQLTNLELALTQLTGTIPSTLGNLTQLAYLSLAANQLTGTIPPSLGYLVQLTWLALDDNQLNGSIPSTLGSLTRLNGLSLPTNQLAGTIPSSLGKLAQLEYLGLFNNAQLTGTIPSTMCSLSGIKIYIDCASVACTCCLDGSTISTATPTISCPSI